VPCYNAARHLRRCLDSLLAQDYPDREIIVVDDASTDESRAMLREYPDVKIVEYGENRGPAYARNRGIDASGGDLLVFLDSDCEVTDPHWLADHVAAHTVPNIIIGGGIHGVGRGLVARADRYCHWLTNIPHSARREVSLGTPRRRVRFSRHLVTTNMSVTRATWTRVGAFDETLPTGEDVEFCERAVTSGVTLRFEPDIVVTHYDRERLADFVRCFYRAGLDRVPARVRHRSQYHSLLPRGIVSSLLLLIPIALLAPAQAIRAWWPYDRRVALYYPFITLACFAMALGIARYWIRERAFRRRHPDAR